MIINWSLIIVIVIIGLVLGLIGGGLFFLINLFLKEYKSKKQWIVKKGVMDFKNPQKKQINEQEIEVPRPQEPIQIPKESSYKEDFKRFQEANKELERGRTEYNKGNITYQELKNLFERLQSQDYYQRVLKGGQYGKKE